MNDRLSTDSPFTQKPVVGVYPPRLYVIRGIPVQEFWGAGPNDWRIPGVTEKFASYAAVEKYIKQTYFGLPVLVYPAGTLNFCGVTTQQIVTPDLQSVYQPVADGEFSFSDFGVVPAPWQKQLEAGREKAKAGLVDTLVGGLIA